MSTSALTIPGAPEPVLVEGVTSYITGSMSSVFGRAQLTARTISFRQYPMWTLMFGALGLLLARWGVVKAHKLIFEVEREALIEIKRGKWGLNKRIIELRSRDGLTLRLAVDDWAKWRAAWPELPA